MRHVPVGGGVGSPVDHRALVTHGTEAGGDAEKCLGEADEQVSVGPQTLMEQIERAALGVGIEVDQHVGADDDIEVLHRPHSEGVRKIQFLESDHLSDGVAQYVAIILQLEVALYRALRQRDRKSTRLNSSHVAISYAVFC